MILPSITCLAYILLLGVLIVYADQKNTFGEHLLRANEIRLITSIETITKVDGNNQEFNHQVHEYYSNQQQRARLELHPSWIESQDEQHMRYYYDYPGGGRLVKYSKVGQGARCELSDINSLVNALFGVISRTSEFFSGESWRDLGAKELPNHLIGLSRMLFVVDHRRHLLSNPVRTKEDLIRDQEVIAYDYVTNDLADPKITIYYVDSEQHGNGTDLPFRISMRTMSGDTVNITFLQVHIVHRDLFDRQKELDFFAFPVGIDCSSSLGKCAASTEWSINPPEVTVSSFRAKVTQYYRSEEDDNVRQVIEYERFVAYDRLAKAMRVDTIEGDKYSINIYDFHRSNLYNILHKAIDQVSDKSEDTDPQCIATSLLFYTTFLHVPYLVQMGRATIRGLDCMAFEYTSRELPPILFNHLDYRNKKGVYFKRAFEQLEQTDQEGDQTDPYTIVYYFMVQIPDPAPRLSFRDVALGALVHVDVFQLGLLEYSFRISNYIYQLMDAPNGDQQDDLFALRDRCVSKGGAQRNAAANYARATFELHYQNNWSTSPPAKEVAHLLAGSMSRNKALVRAISSTSFEIPATKIYDVQSSLELRDEQKQLVISGTCSFVQADVDTVDARVVAFSDLWWLQAFQASYEQCFWEAARRRQHSANGLVLFVACKSYCSIDESPEVFGGAENSEQKFDSHQFSIKDEPSEGSCAVFLLEPEQGSSDSPFKSWDKAYKTLKDNTLDLALADGDETKLDKRLLFKVNQLEISNDRWSSSLGYEVATVDGKHSSLEGGELLVGVGLTPTSGHLERPPLTQSSPMSYDVCHSICMANMSCNSFSVCLTGNGIECITSHVDIGEMSILTQLEGKRKEANNERNHLITVLLPAAAQASEDKPTEVKEEKEAIEFRVDLRCKLYKKDALEMFHLSEPIQVELKNANVRSVSGPAECAELCLQSNLAFFKKMSLVRLELINKTPEESTGQFIEEYQNNLSLWCSSFRYLNLLNHNLPEKEIAKVIAASKLDKAGLCSMMRPITTVTLRPEDSKNENYEHESPKEVLKAEFKQYRFIYTSLYEAQYGRRMLVKRLDNNRKQTRELETVRLWSSDVETCARACLLQSSSLKPWCKSFDFVEKFVGPSMPSITATDTQWISSYCVLNSLSLSDVRDSMDDYIEEITESDVNSWHYEPRDTFSIDVLAETRALVFADTLSSGGSYLYPPKSEHRALWMFLIMLLALVCSSWLVVSKGSAIIDNFYKSHSIGASTPPSTRRIRFNLPDHIDLAEMQE